MKCTTIILAVLIALLATTAWARLADPTGNGEPTIYLGKIPVTGQKNIVKTLQAIKIAMKSPFSTDPADADKIVCRINKVLGDAREYLDCATNRDYIVRRWNTQIRMLSTQSDGGACGECQRVIAIRNMLALQPDHRLHVPVNGGSFQKLLDSIQLPAAETVAAPAAASGH
jgi:hypothetical protein